MTSRQALTFRSLLTSCSLIGRPDVFRLTLFRHVMSKFPPDDVSSLSSRLIQSLHDQSLIALDVTGNIRSWSPGSKRVLGYDESSVIGKRISIFYPDDAAARGAVDEELHRAAADGEFATEAWQVRADGERFWAQIATAALRDDAGEIIGYSRVTRDITIRLKAEEALRVSEAKFSGIVSIASEAIVSVDESHHIVLYNQGAEQIFGYTAEEAIGEPLDLLIPEEYHDTHSDHIRKFAASSQVTRRMGQRGEIDIWGRRKSGEVFPAEASISKLEIGGRRFYTSVLRDITERQLAERDKEALLERERKARSEAEDAAQARDDVLRIVSHDLGNSLSAMLVTTRVLLRTLPPSDWSASARERIEALRSLAEQMQRLRKDLLDVARIEAGQLSIVPERHDPEALIEAVHRDFAALASEKGIDLVQDVEPRLPAVFADPERVHQVLSNLVGNALKFTPEGGEIRLEARARNKSVCFSIVDTGIGIPAEDLPHVFDRYWQAKTAHRAGAGLGLAISKGITETHGGQIWVESREGEGSRFSFTIPTTAPSARSY